MLVISTRVGTETWHEKQPAMGNADKHLRKSESWGEFNMKPGSYTSRHGSPATSKRKDWRLGEEFVWQEYAYSYASSLHT
ncbi:hypothetical protein TESG_08569 [Trichophyton tonsurans CBS 112818]|uniref:Uncharacterized protein n=1 Tax=Trichophyton tonsurans (strain CBS 112818) TaxID=647933 RepID=F2S5N0_TRIT1|nr:hypothetical protein TESG_08569 [Trichophyton tonsurans CBS 112818]